MHIAYVSSFDATDITSYSGTGYFIPKKLQDTGDNVEYIGNLKEVNPAYLKIKRKIYDLAGKKYLIERNPKLLAVWAREINKRMSKDVDMLLGYSSQPFSKLKTNKPTFFWADAVFASMIDYYDVYSNLCKESIDDGNNMEKEAIHNVSCAVFSSDWAANEAILHYGANPEKVRVVTYGANIDVGYNLSDIENLAASKSFKICNLLFLGVEWKRKGGDKAVEIAKKLIDMGVRVKLSLVGVDPGQEVKNLHFVESYGFVSKSTPEGKALLNKLIADSHFLLLPTRADCTPIVYSELNAHGIPVVTTNEGGIPSLVKQGINGFLFDKDDRAEDFARCVFDIFENPSEYVELSKSSFNEYKTRLNWDTSIKKFREVLKEFA